MTLTLAQTFIRSASGKALTDTPALNAHSRAVLIPLTRAPTALATSVSIPGPGPIEAPKITSTASLSTKLDVSKPPPPIPANAAASDLLDMNETSSPVDVDDDDAIPSNAGDPYSNLDGAFGGYAADEPQPMSTLRKGTRGDLEDLLF